MLTEDEEVDQMDVHIDKGTEDTPNLVLEKIYPKW